MLTRSKALKLLGVSKNNPSDDELKKSYRRMANKYHPDKATGDATKFREMKEAYDFLLEDDVIIEKQKTHHEKKSSGASAYNQQRSYSKTVEEMMAEFNDKLKREDDRRFGFGFDEHSGKNRSKRQGHQSHVEYDPFGYVDSELDRKKSKENVETGFEFNRTSPSFRTCRLSLDQAMLGGAWSTTISYKVECEKCGGTGDIINPDPNAPWNKYHIDCIECDATGRVIDSKIIPVDIPVGVMDGDTTIIQIKMNHVPRSPVDIITVIFKVEEHDKYKVDGNNLYLDIDVPFDVAILGGQIEFNTLKNTRITLNIMSHTKSGTLLRIPTHGVTERGDLFCVVNITVPDVMSDGQIECIQTFTKG